MNSSQQPRFLLVNLGHIRPPMFDRFGDYDTRYERLLRAGVPASACERWNLIDDPQTPLPNVGTFDGVVLSGGGSMVSKGGAWLEAAVALIHEAQKLKVPVLGVCLGHQTIAHSAGGVVGPIGLNKNLGTRQVTLLEAGVQDALLGQLPSRFVANVSHSEGVQRLSPQITPLARTEYDMCHALRVGERTWGVQYHPEFTYDFMHAQLTMEATRAALPGEQWEKAMGELSETLHATSVLERFARWCAANRR